MGREKRRQAVCVCMPVERERQHIHTDMKEAGRREKCRRDAVPSDEGTVAVEQRLCQPVCVSVCLTQAKRAGVGGRGTGMTTTKRARERERR